MIVATAIISITLNPLAFRMIDPIDRWLARARPARAANAEELEVGASSTLDPLSRAIVVGYGPTGRTVARLLRENGVSPTVVDLNMDVVRQLRDEGVSAVYGDARHHDTLVTAGLPHAAHADRERRRHRVTGRHQRGARDQSRTCTSSCAATICATCLPLRSAGAEQVFAGEGEVALAMTEAVLRRLGATPDQIDRERVRVSAASSSKRPASAKYSSPPRARSADSVDPCSLSRSAALPSDRSTHTGAAPSRSPSG